jgi:hypothetical protein
MADRLDSTFLALLHLLKHPLGQLGGFLNRGLLGFRDFDFPWGDFCCGDFVFLGCCGHLNLLVV